MGKRHVRRTSNRPPPTRRAPGPPDHPPFDELVPPRALNPNVLLAALPDPEYARVSPTLDRVRVEVKQFLHTPGETPTHVYFPGDGFCSELAVLQDGTMVETAIVGREGAAGLLGANNGRPMASTATMVQGPMMTCYRMTAVAFREEMERRGAFYAVVSDYLHVLTSLVMQATACNAVHHVEQRLARWLLTAHDRMQANNFPLTQEFVAMMLGVARPTVTIVSGTLQKAGLIQFHRGQLTIVDREQLEEAACECYRTAANLVEALGSTTRIPPTTPAKRP